MYGRILVTLDGSALSEAVLPEVERLAEGTNARIILLTVAEPPEATVAWAMETQPPLITVGTLAQAAVATLAPVRREESRSQAIERVRAELKAYLEEKARPLRQRGIEVECLVRLGEPAETILEYARTHDIDLIAMATHGRSGLGRLVFGSVASRVLESGVRPVLLVRPRKLGG